MAVVVLQFRSDAHIPDMRLRNLGEKDIAEDAAEAPHVLVFEVAAVAPLEDLGRHRIFAGADERGDVKLGGEMAHLAESDWLSVDEQVEARIDAGEREECLAAFP